MQRMCDGNDPNLIGEDGTSPCACGLVFNDVNRAVIHPHAFVGRYGPIAVTISAQMGIDPAVPMTEGQAREFAVRYDTAVREHERRVSLPLSSGSALSEEHISQLLSECVTVVRPGETLILRVGREWTPNQMREVQDRMDAVIGSRELPFKAITVPCDELGVAVNEVTHQCPPDGGSFTPCCGLTPWELPRTDRMTLHADLVTCNGARGTS